MTVRAPLRRKSHDQLSDKSIQRIKQGKRAGLDHHQAASQRRGKDASGKTASHDGATRVLRLARLGPDQAPHTLLRGRGIDTKGKTDVELGGLGPVLQGIGKDGLETDVGGGVHLLNHIEEGDAIDITIRANN